MNSSPEASLPSAQNTDGASVVITHRVPPDQLAAHDVWLARIVPLCKAAPGFLDWHIVRPIPGLTSTYTIVIRFDTEANLRAWMESDTRAQLIEQAQPYLVDGDRLHYSSGLDFWFTPPGSKTQVPVRWKQYLLTWSAIYPLVFAMPLIVVPLLHALRLPEARWLSTLLITAIVVFLMVYVVMPRYTRLTRKWLFR